MGARSARERHRAHRRALRHDRGPLQQPGVRCDQDYRHSATALRHRGGHRARGAVARLFRLRPGHRAHAGHGRRFVAPLGGGAAPRRSPDDREFTAGAA